MKEESLGRSLHGENIIVACACVVAACMHVGTSHKTLEAAV